MVGIRRLGVAIALFACGCTFMTDAATRLATDIVRNARALESSADTDRTFVHHPTASPAGCAGSYQVTFDSGGGLSVSCDRLYPQVSYSTTSHRGAVTIPAPLSVVKAAGEPLNVTLHKQGATIAITRVF
jgi:hypothetical protein